MGSFVLAAVLAGCPLPLLLLLSSAAEQWWDIPAQTEPVVEVEPHSSDMVDGLEGGKLKSLPLPPVAVDGQVFGGSVQHAVARPMLRYLPQLGSVVRLEVRSQQSCLHAGC